MTYETDCLDDYAKTNADELRREIARYRRLIDEGVDPEQNGTFLELIYRAEARLRGV